MFIENASAVDITMSSVKTQAAIFKSRFGVKEHEKVLRRRTTIIGFKTKQVISQ